MASPSSEPNLKPEGACGGDGGSADGSGSGGGFGGESSEAAVPNDQLLLYRGVKKAKKERACTAKERISKMPPCAAGKRSSIYRGVTRHRWTGRYEAHLWDKSTWNQNQNKKGKQGVSLFPAFTPAVHTFKSVFTGQIVTFYHFIVHSNTCNLAFLSNFGGHMLPVYLGAYDEEEAAARAYDLAALKYWGPGTLINFPVTDYARDLEEMQNVSREEYLTSLRRKSSGFSRGISKYRGLSSNRWESSFGCMSGADHSSQHYGNDVVAEDEYLGGFRVERKIDLTSYIKWWDTDKPRQPDCTKASVETKCGYSEDIGNELKSLEWAVRPTEPYQMPQLGTRYEGKRIKDSKTSALGILSQSAAYKSLQEKSSRKKETVDDEKDGNMNRMGCSKAVEESGRLGLQQNAFSWVPLLSAPLVTDYSSTIEASEDPILWSSLVPVLPPGLPPVAEKCTNLDARCKD